MGGIAHTRPRRPHLTFAARAGPQERRVPNRHLTTQATAREPQHVSLKEHAMPTKSHTLSANDRNEIDDSKFAFPKQRKEPLEDATHVRNAIARFDQVKDVSDEDREQAFHRIKAAAKKFNVEMKETHWNQLGKQPHTNNSSHS
jgi:hypothetical protein